LSVTLFEKNPIPGKSLLPVQAFLLASAVVIQALVDVIAGLLLAAHQFEPDARVVGEVDQVDPQVPGFDRLRQVHDRHGGAVQDSELDGRVVDVPELPHLVGEIVGVHQTNGRRESELAIGTENTLDTESPEISNRFQSDN